MGCESTGENIFFWFIVTLSGHSGMYVLDWHKTTELIWMIIDTHITYMGYSVCYTIPLTSLADVSPANLWPHCSYHGCCHCTINSEGKHVTNLHASNSNIFCVSCHERAEQKLNQDGSNERQSLCMCMNGNSDVKNNQFYCSIIIIILT